MQSGGGHSCPAATRFAPWPSQDSTTGSIHALSLCTRRAWRSTAASSERAMRTGLIPRRHAQSICSSMNPGSTCRASPLRMLGPDWQPPFHRRQYAGGISCPSPLSRFERLETSRRAGRADPGDFRGGCGEGFGVQFAECVRQHARRPNATPGSSPPDTSGQTEPTSRQSPRKPTGCPRGRPIRR